MKMTKILSCLLLSAALSACTSTPTRPAATQPTTLPAGLSLLPLDLPDDKVWVLGDDGSGRSFMVSLVFVNAAKTPITFYETNVDGVDCLGVVLTDAKGKETVLPHPPMAQAGGPSAIILRPGERVGIEFDLSAMVGQHGLPPGPYMLWGFYKNDLKADGKFIKGEVWTGRMETTVVKIKVVSPATVKTPTTRPVDEKAVAKLMLQLGDADFAVREQATKKLLQLGEAVRPLAAAQLDKKGLAPEVAQRISTLIDALDAARLPLSRVAFSDDNGRVFRVTDANAIRRIGDWLKKAESGPESRKAMAVGLASDAVLDIDPSPDDPTPPRRVELYIEAGLVSGREVTGEQFAELLEVLIKATAPAN